MGKNFLNFFFAFFIHPEIEKDSARYEKLKMLVVLLMLVFSILFLYTLYFLVNGVFINAKALENYIALLTTFICLMVIKRTGNFLLPLYLLTFMAYLFITLSAYYSGGIFSNDVSWYFVVPVASMMLIGVRAGVITTVLSLLCTTLFYVLEVRHHKDFVSDSLSYGLEYKFANSFFILLFLILIIYILVDSNRKLQAILQLNRDQELRENIARDFHDQIGNRLASIQHLTSLVAMNKTELEKEVIYHKIGNNAKEVYDSFKDFIWTKEPQSSQLKEVFMYLRDYAEDYLKYSNINFYIQCSPDELPEVTIPPEWNKELVLVFKEALTNAYKHAKAKNIYFNFTFENHTIGIQVKDDGVGMNIDDAPKGNGLKNLKYRSELLNGTLEILSAIGKGTEVSFLATLP